MRHAKARCSRPFCETPYVLRMMPNVLRVMPIIEQTIAVTAATDRLGRGIALHVAERGATVTTKSTT